MKENISLSNKTGLLAFLFFHTGEQILMTITEPEGSQYPWVIVFLIN